MGDFLKAVGLLVVAGGAYFLYLAFNINVLVSDGGGGLVANQPLMSQRTDTMSFGGVLFVSGWIMFFGATLSDRLAQISRRLARTEAENNDPDL